MYAIESGIEIPPRMASRKKGKPALPATLEKLKVGESVLVADMSGSGIAAAMIYTARKTGYGFTMRGMPNGVRVWRVRAKRKG